MLNLPNSGESLGNFREASSNQWKMIQMRLWRKICLSSIEHRQHIFIGVEPPIQTEEKKEFQTDSMIGKYGRNLNNFPHESLSKWWLKGNSGKITHRFHANVPLLTLSSSLTRMEMYAIRFLSHFMRQIQHTWSYPSIYLFVDCRETQLNFERLKPQKENP